MERGAVVELPMLDTVIAFGMHRQNGCYLAAARDNVSARRNRELRLLHDQAMLLQPPVRTVEFPLRRRDTAFSLQCLVAAEPYAPRARILGPQTPRFRPGPGGRAGITQGCDELRRNRLDHRLRTD